MLDRQNCNFEDLICLENNEHNMNYCLIKEKTTLEFKYLKI